MHPKRILYAPFTRALERIGDRVKREIVLLIEFWVQNPRQCWDRGVQKGGFWGLLIDLLEPLRPPRRVVGGLPGSKAVIIRVIWLLWMAVGVLDGGLLPGIPVAVWVKGSVDMAEVVEEMPGDSASGGAKYDWESWLDGRVWKLTQTVVLDAVVDEAGNVVVPEQVVEGDFSTEVEKMRSYARNAAKRRKFSKSAKTKSDVEVIEVTRVAGEAPVKVERPVLFMQGVEKSPTGGRPGRPRKDPGISDGEQMALPLEDSDVAAAQAELDAMGSPVRQSDIEQPASDEDVPEWVEIPVEEDAEDPFAPQTGDYPAADVEEMEPVAGSSPQEITAAFDEMV